MTITNNSVYILNDQINAVDLLDALKRRINNIYVLAAIAATHDFINFDEKIIQHYFWIIESFANEIKELVELFSAKFVNSN